MIDTAVIGGGAAGLFAACFLTKHGIDLVLLEKNHECGRKLLTTGHGRCNITNLKPPAELKKGYHEAGNFVYPAIRGFTPSDCVDFLNNDLKLRTKVEENDRVFPVSDKASDVRDAMVRYIGREHIVTGFDCVSVTRDNEGFTVTSSTGQEIKAKHLILACGGKSYPHTGSDGSGFSLASSLGHKIVPPRSALAPVRTSAELCSRLAGVTCVNARLSLWTGGKKTASYGGDLLFTHSGISGPAVMELSREIPPVITEDTYILADLAPSLDEKIFTSEVNGRPNTKLVNLVSEYVPRSVASALCGDDELYCRDCRSEVRKAVYRRLKELRFDIEEVPDINTAYCTRGGVFLNELDRDSYQSKVVPGLYVIGENTDVDGISGGYNLAFAAASAHLAVMDIVG